MNVYEENAFNEEEKNFIYNEDVDDKTEIFDDAIYDYDEMDEALNEKNYSDVQLIDSTLNISDLLLGAGAINAKEECAKSIGFVNGPRYLNGVRVVIVAKPSAEFVAAVFGTWLSGGVAVPLALSYPESELLHVMNDSDISMILSTQDHQGIMENMAVKCSARLSLLPTLARSVVEFMPKFSVRGQSVWQRWCDSYPKDRNTVEDAITVFTGVPIMYTRLMFFHILYETIGRYYMSSSTRT
ncbi:hypothetical protein ZIOFF_068416 [Zingiber officinale]|uniref:AMP-dependent synthetase/ligase domain-containing protein n=1 Tax=Zingiber officinale TaxID=94328 RepID=A0A8J5CHA4_ZINOF|nr:hypothetical protein ZIOFF_068416 [Zingiber officinale]